ncbi:hypothetical protein AVEN_250930-1, partial [Araneus ventricosus]
HLSGCRRNLFNLAWQKSRPCPLSQFSAAVFTSLSYDNLVPDKCLEPRFGAKSGLYGGWLETSHLNLCNNSRILRTIWVSSCRRMTPSLNMPGRLRRMASRWTSD